MDQCRILQKRTVSTWSVRVLTREYFDIRTRFRGETERKTISTRLDFHHSIPTFTPTPTPTLTPTFMPTPLQTHYWIFALQVTSSFSFFDKALSHRIINTFNRSAVRLSVCLICPSISLFVPLFLGMLFVSLSIPILFWCAIAPL